MAKQHFSTQLEDWMATDEDKTVGDLQRVFGEKSFAILILIFMFIPSLPIPTGGATALVIIPTVLVASLQLIFGRRTLWLPKRLSKVKLGDKTIKKALPFMIRRIKWMEKYTRPRFSDLFDKAVFRSIIGVSVFILALAAVISPPFSWLDTLPSMGAVFISLSMILEDFAFFVIGIVLGTTGLSLLVLAANLIKAFVNTIF